MLMHRVDATEISGAVTIVARRGRVVQYEAVGEADIETKKPMTKETLFRLASSSKPITAVAVLMLMKDGKLKRADPVSKYIPEFKNSRVMAETEHIPEPMSDHPSSAEKTYTVPADHDITIIDLLTHFGPR